MLMFFCGGAEARGVSESDLAASLKALSQGRPVSFLDDKLDPNQNFYVLGISPNAARLSVRFFLRNSFGQFAKNLQDHADRLSITRPAFDKRENLSVWALALVMPMTSKPISTIIISCIAVLAISCKISTFYWRYQVKMRKNQRYHYLRGGYGQRRDQQKRRHTSCHKRRAFFR